MKERQTEKKTFALGVSEESREMQQTCGDGLRDLPLHCLKITDHNLEKAMQLRAQSE